MLKRPKRFLLIAVLCTYLHTNVSFVENVISI